jgi:hypothetical protein
MNDTTYNGWTNYETWVVKLWLDNDQGSSEWMEETARECLQEAIDNDESDIQAAARGSLADRLESYHDEMQELCETQVAGVFADLLNSALGRVEWREIAENILGDIPVYSAGWNMPGYTPDNTPAMFLDADDALEYIKDEIQRADEEQEDDDGQEPIDTSTIKADGAGEFGQTIGAYHYFVTKV